MNRHEQNRDDARIGAELWNLGLSLAADILNDMPRFEEVIGLVEQLDEEEKEKITAEVDIAELSADAYALGVELFERGDFARARTWLLRAARYGNDLADAKIAQVDEISIMLSDLEAAEGEELNLDADLLSLDLDPDEGDAVAEAQAQAAQIIADARRQALVIVAHARTRAQHTISSPTDSEWDKAVRLALLRGRLRTFALPTNSSTIAGSLARVTRMQPVVDCAVCLRLNGKSHATFRILVKLVRSWNVAPCCDRSNVDLRGRILQRVTATMAPGPFEASTDFCLATGCGSLAVSNGGRNTTVFHAVSEALHETRPSSLLLPQGLITPSWPFVGEELPAHSGQASMLRTNAEELLREYALH